jgi:hypothetical protein
MVDLLKDEEILKIYLRLGPGPEQIPTHLELKSMR